MPAVDYGATPLLAPRMSLIGTAASYLNWALEVPPGSNQGQVVAAMLKSVGLVGAYPWCAAAVHLWGWGTCWDPATGTSHWPLPATGGCAELGAFAAKHELLRETPQVGDIFLIWHTITHKDGSVEQRFGHTGVVTMVDSSGHYKTIEGNTARNGTREGIGVFDLTRTVRPKDRFIDWTKLL